MLTTKFRSGDFINEQYSVLNLCLCGLSKIKDVSMAVPGKVHFVPMFFFCLIGALSLPAIGQLRVHQTGGFNRLAREATKARATGRMEEAISFYRKALALRPGWDEGWWYVGTLLYDKDDYAEAAQAFRKATNLQPKVGAAWAMLGLCEYQGGRYDDALIHIRQGRRLGVNNNPALDRVGRYHEGLLLLLRSEFETSQQVLGGLSDEGVSSQNLIIALGLAVLRLPLQPGSIDATYRDWDLIRRTGMAEHLAAQRNTGDAQGEYERVARDFANTPNVNYAYGRYLLENRNDDEALLAFQREIEVSPRHALARLQIAYVRLKNKEAIRGLSYAEEAVKINPRLPLGHYLLGRILFDKGEMTRSIEELEIARRLVPNEPRVYFALSRAYDRANRKAEAARARDTFSRLTRLAEEAASRGLSVNDAIQENIINDIPNVP
jgi:tetratricopeptide (TPR) repeat protein